MSISRPSLGSRAVSDIHPLVTPMAPQGEKDLGFGSHAISAGTKLSSGKRMVLGGIAPLSPFLPLPPPPSAEELQNLHDTDTPRGSHLAPPFNSQRRASSNDVGNHHATKPKSDVPAPLMIRSYSMPVATQRDFEAQRKADISRRNEYLQQEELAPKHRTPLRPFHKSEMNASHFMQREQSKESYFTAKKQHDLSPNSSSDENDEASTPRAASPIYTECGDWKDACDPVLSFSVHPDHLKAPPMFS